LLWSVLLTKETKVPEKAIDLLIYNIINYRYRFVEYT